MPQFVRVLLADDSAHIREVLRSLLASEPIDVVGEAADGLEAVRLVTAQDVDVAILDLMMPVLNGIEATRQIRQQSLGTRVVLLTGHAEPYHILGAFDAGVCGYVAKKDAGEELTQAIHEVFRGNRYLSAAISRVVSGANPPGA